MLLKHAAQLITGSVLLCLIVSSAAAQPPEEDRQAVAADQQEIDDAYRQLEQDRRDGNSAGIEIDQDNIATAEQDFQADEERAIADDQQTIAADQAALAALNQQLQQDQGGNAGAVAGDENNIKTAAQKLQADKQQTVADDKLEVTRDQQALDNENSQLHEDMQSNIYAVGGADIVQGDEASIKEAVTILQHAQVKLQVDSSNQSPPPQP